MDTASAIVQHYPSFRSLVVEHYWNEGNCLLFVEKMAVLTDLMVVIELSVQAKESLLCSLNVAKGNNNHHRNLGKTLSKKIYRVFTESNPEAEIL